jgi:formaldehyde-activating enzyme
MKIRLKDVDGRVGASWGGSAAHAVNANVVVARRGSRTAAAILATLGTPTASNAPFLATPSDGDLAPAVVVVNRAPIACEAHARLTWGAGQLGVTDGVRDALVTCKAEEVAADLVLLVSLLIDPMATDDVVIHASSREATARALEQALRRGQVAGNSSK